MWLKYSSDMNDPYKSVNSCNSWKKQILIMFDDIIANKISDNKLKKIVTELFISSRKLNIL